FLSAPPRDTPTSLVGGQAYYVGGTTRCSAGFAVTKGTQRGFVTAGHCGDAGDATVGFNRRPQGVVQASHFPGDDFSWVAVNDGWNPRPLVGNDDGAVEVYGTRQALPGASVCLPGSGAGTGWHCGILQQRDADITYSQGVVEHLTRTTVCSEPGGSGGPVISIDQAQGIVSGGSGGCDSGGFTYFQPIGEILSAYGLILADSDRQPWASTGTCGGYPATFTGTLKNAQSVYQPGNRHYHSAVSGEHYGCLESSLGGDFDLYLQKQTASGWSTVSSSDSPAAFEEFRYFGTPGNYRYLIVAASGSGSYKLGYTKP
ncbi:S1 family peptidase, partial [Streptosporangium sp. NPDC048865]|uniref:S1 family peptidase n=1 Tax=Streptosporangium sp. NPDC048865 TaxID=3155766 RepID=UPI003446B56F